MQSGELEAVGSTSVNFQATVEGVSPQSCSWNFDDGSTSDSCNPPSHSFDTPGAYTVRVTINTVCSDPIEQSIDVLVFEAEQSSSSISSISSKPSASSSSSSQSSQCTATSSTSVFINEFLPNPVGSDADNEWIELYNNSSASLTLCGWSLDDEEGGSSPFDLEDITMGAGEYLRLDRSLTKIALNNDADEVRLFRNDQLTHNVEYSNSKEGESYARESNGNFAWTITPTPGAENRIEQESSSSSSSSSSSISSKSSASSISSQRKSSSSSSSTSYAHVVWISEVFASPPPGEEEWIELWNLSDEDVDITGWMLDDERDAGSRPWEIEGVQIAARQSVIITNDQSRIAFNNSGDDVWLISPDGKILEGVVYPKLSRGESYARISEDEWCVTTTATPNEQNSCSEMGKEEEETSPRERAEQIQADVQERVDNINQRVQQKREELQERFRNVSAVKEETEQAIDEALEPLLPLVEERNTQPRTEATPNEPSPYPQLPPEALFLSILVVPALKMLMG